jgi:hypothetical protein
VKTPRLPPEPLPVAVARAVFLVITVAVATAVVSLVFLDWRMLVIGLGGTLVSLAYLALEANQAQARRDR